MKYQKPVNTVNSNDEFSSGLMEAYGKWMGGDTFQNTTISEAPFDGMDPQSNGAEIEDTTKRKKTAKKGGYIGQESAPKNEEVEVLEREEYEVDGQTYVIEKIKGADGKACWKGYKYAGTKNGKDECVKAGVEYEGEEDLAEASYSAKAARAGKDIGKPGKNFSKIAKSAGEKYGSEEKGKKVAGAVLAKLRKEGMDPVGKEDGDIDNDGDKDKSDKYLAARRKKIGKILAMKGKK